MNLSWNFGDWSIKSWNSKKKIENAKCIWTFDENLRNSEELLRYWNFFWKFHKKMLEYFWETVDYKLIMEILEIGWHRKLGMKLENVDETKHWNLKPSLLEDCWNLLFINLLKPIVHNFVIYLHEDSKNPLFKEFKISVSKTFWIYSLLIF